MPNHHHLGPTIATTWQLASGSVAAMAGATLQDDRLAVFINPSSNSVSQFTLSPSGRYVVVGDVWLSDRKSLRALLPEREADLLSGELSSDLQWIAAAWEQKGIDTFSQLIGIFGLAVWDREQQLLWLGRDRTGGRTLYYTWQGTTRWIAPNLRSLNRFHPQEVDPSPCGTTCAAPLSPEHGQCGRVCESYDPAASLPFLGIKSSIIGNYEKI
jgi:asparagine synthase (glutamine-hydrolysing)